ncbi:MAG TPA: ABC transporter permease [Blastocatellia bacterium]|nr:ABC transporter permease [Blastocatellia bacterium]
MLDHNKQRITSLSRRLIALISVIVPRRFRARWRREWEAELEYRESLLARWERLNLGAKLELLRRSLGAFRDALWLQQLRLEDEMFQDLRYGARMLLTQKSFTAVAVLSLALGIGANTAIFQLLDAVRLRMLPVKAPHELAEVRLTTLNGMRGTMSGRYSSVTNPIWEQVRERQEAFSGICAWSVYDFNLAQGGEVRRARGLLVSGDFFNVLGVRPVLGRVFTATDDQRGCAAPGVVISHAFWQREYAGATDIVGRKLTLGDDPFEIVGVTQPDFFGLEVGRSFDLALPICADRDRRLDSGTNWWLMMTGRLKPGWSLERATAQLQLISPSLFEKTLPVNYPTANVKDYLDFKLEAVSAAAGYSRLRQNYEDSLWLLLAIAGLVLLIACANLANLLLARANVRGRELAVRQALGASRARLVRQLLVESLLLAFIGAGLGALLAQFLSQFLVSYLGNSVFLDLSADWRVFGFAAALAGLTCVLFGLAPAVRATRIEPGAVMKAGGRGLTAGRERYGLRRALVIAQVALSLVLVAGATLFTRSLNKLLTVDSGFRQEDVLMAQIGVGRLNLAPERRLLFRQETLDRIRLIPGVKAVTDTTVVPLSGSSSGNAVWMDGADARQKVNTNRSWIGPDYFKALETPLVAGREFNERDTATAPYVAIVNESFARRHLNGANPVGRRFWMEARPTAPETLYEIVGQVKDTKYGGLSDTPGPIMFLSIAQEQRFLPFGQLLIRSDLPQSEITAAVTRVLNEINPAISVSYQGFKSMVEGSILRERLLATLSGFFGALALLLASIGLYGILAYGVTSRTNEIGIRMALGAQARNVRWLVLREALALLIAGVAVGAPLVVAVTRLARTLLYDLTPTDPVSLGLAALLLFAVTLLAGYLPARRATKIDPIAALRHE